MRINQTTGALQHGSRTPARTFQHISLAHIQLVASMATQAQGRKVQQGDAKFKQHLSASNVMHPPGTQPPASTPGSSGRSSTSPTAISHAASNSQELSWATVQSVRAQLGASHPIAVEVARLYSEQGASKGTYPSSAAPFPGPRSNRAITHLPNGQIDVISGSEQLSDTAQAATQQAKQLAAQGRLEEASALLQAALACAKAAGPAQLAESVHLSNRLACVLYQLEQWDSAYEHYDWLMSVLAVDADQDPQSIYTVRWGRAMCLLFMGRHSKALPQLQQCWDSPHRQTLLPLAACGATLQGLLVCHSHLKQHAPVRLQQAAEQMIQQLQQHKDTQPYDLLSVALLDHLAASQLQANHPDVAETLKELLPLSMKVHGAGGPARAQHLQSQAVHLMQQGSYAKATSVCQMVLHLQKTQHGEAHAEVLKSALLLGQCYALAGRYTDAHGVLEEVWQRAVAVLGRDHRDVAELLYCHLSCCVRLKGEAGVLQLCGSALAQGVPEDVILASVRRLGLGNPAQAGIIML